MLKHETETIKTKDAATQEEQTTLSSDSLLIRLLTTHILESSAKIKLQLQVKVQLQR